MKRATRNASRGGLFSLVMLVCMAVACMGCGGTDDLMKCNGDATCNDHGTCDDSSGAPVCTCETGYAGIFCQDCATGYTASAEGICEVSDPCVVDTTCAGENRVCEDQAGTATCTDCLVGFYEDGAGSCVADENCDGVTCSGHGHCLIDEGVASCVCEIGYEGADCSGCSAGFHDESGACVADAQCLPNSCSGHGDCSVDGAGVLCACDAGYAGDYCESCLADFHHTPDGLCEADESCDDEDCSAHGTCSLVDGLTECACADGYAGDSCERCAAGHHVNGDGVCVLDESCLADTCSGHGTCQVTDGVVECVDCLAGYEGDFCENCKTDYHLDANGNCVADDSCDGIDCSGHGTCSLVGGLTECACDDGYAGLLCADCAPGYHAVDGDCILDETCLDSTCYGHGTCALVDGVVLCTECETGYTGTHCQLCDTDFHRMADGSCAPDESCDGNDCSSHGTCSLVDGLAVCSCDDGYAGTSCADCAAGHHAADGACELDETCLANTCAGHGTCEVINGLVQCASCDTGYAGTWCETCDNNFHQLPDGTCVADESCVDVDCGMGNCVLMGGVAVCDCPEAYMGDACEYCAPGYHPDPMGVDGCMLDETCDGMDCGSHGYCSVWGGVAACHCDVGYAGAFCESCYEGYSQHPWSGQCEIPCEQGSHFFRCDGICTYGYDSDNCGACGIQCVGDEICNGDGMNQPGCYCPADNNDWNYDYCDGICTYLRSLENCGACGVGCGDGQKCILGNCVDEDPICQEMGWCHEPNTLCCEGNCYWEEELRSNQNHCGSCDACTAPAACVIDTCYDSGIVCDPPCWEGAVCCSDPWGGNRCYASWELEWDPNNCGACGVVCGENMQCVEASCRCPIWDPQFAECDGVCLNVWFDESNCGECGLPCGDDEACVFGECQPRNSENCGGACGEEQLCCTLPEMPFIACLDILQMAWDNQNCGGCGVVCEGEASCQNGDCFCPVDWGDPSYAYCDGICTRVDTTENCGECGLVCSGDQVCWNTGEPEEEGYQCVCPADWGDSNYAYCDVSGEPVCTNISNNEQFCGNCETACLAGETCFNGNCLVENSDCGEPGTCAAMYGESHFCCDSGWGGECQDLMWDTRHCGECNNACGENEYCNGGQCMCPSEWGDINYGICDSPTGPVCRYLPSDDNNCGECGNVCDPSARCVFGTCQVEDPACEAAGDDCEMWDEGGFCCDATCVDLAWDVNNCGACANVCDECQWGQCILCGNGICDSNAEWDWCPLDCSCGNGECEGGWGEDPESCPADCT